MKDENGRHLETTFSATVPCMKYVCILLSQWSSWQCTSSGSVWQQPDDKPLSEPMMVRFIEDICVTQPRWFSIVDIKNSVWSLISMMSVQQFQMIANPYTNFTQDPFYQNWLPLGPAWKSNCIHTKCGMKLFIHSQISMVQPLKFANE